MKKLTKKQDVKTEQKSKQDKDATKGSAKNAQCCAKTSRTAVGCHD